MELRDEILSGQISVSSVCKQFQKPSVLPSFWTHNWMGKYGYVLRMSCPVGPPLSGIVGTGKILVTIAITWKLRFTSLNCVSSITPCCTASFSLGRTCNGQTRSYSTLVLTPVRARVTKGQAGPYRFNHHNKSVTWLILVDDVKL